MAKSRPFKFFLSLIILFAVAGVLAIIGAVFVAQRGPSVPEHSPLKEKQGDNRAFIERTRKLMGIGPRQA